MVTSMSGLKAGPLHNNTSQKQEEARNLLRTLFRERPISDELLLTNFGLFARSSALSKIFFLYEAYSKIRALPGDIYVFGVWLGQDMVVFESMRAMLEPYNVSRKIIGFDTFDGYKGLSGKDNVSEETVKSGYIVERDYQVFLERLLSYHRAENTMGHAVTHRLVGGDISETCPRYFGDNQASMVALAYFDIALYAPTKAALDAISPRLMPGSVIALDEMNDPRYSGETVAFREWANGKAYTIERSQFLPDRTFVTVC